jgi:hypothetical protein
MSRRAKKIGTLVKRAKEHEARRRNTARTLFFINSVIWLGYMVYVYYDMAVLNKNTSSADIATLVVFCNAVALFFSGWLLGKLRDAPYLFAMIVAFLNGMLSLMNFANYFFLASFFSDAVILWLLYQLRRSYLSILYETDS